MVKVILVQSSSSIYDDRAGSHYHFPSRYLARLEQAGGDWAIFYSPVKDTGVSSDRRGSYYAVARLGEISPDPREDGLHYVAIDQETYADFAQTVPRKLHGKFLEPAMSGKNENANVGVALQAVRWLPEESFEEIIGLAWRGTESELPRLVDTTQSNKGVSEAAIPFEFDVQRTTVEQLVNRKVRDPRFRASVLIAYEKKCAITGWSFINGGGRAEVEAAHIKPVEHGGPDQIANGLALSGTVHWMFDRGLLGVADNDDIIISTKVNDRDSVERLLNSTGKIVRPARPEHQPHELFLKWHREYHGMAA